MLCRQTTVDAGQNPPGCTRPQRNTPRTGFHTDPFQAAVAWYIDPRPARRGRCRRPRNRSRLHLGRGTMLAATMVELSPGAWSSNVLMTRVSSICRIEDQSVPRSSMERSVRHGHDVPARGRELGIEHGRHGDVEPRCVGDFPALDVVERPLNVVEISPM